jgi:hypothetical protein
MKTKLIAILVTANAAWSAVPALADDCIIANLYCRRAVAPMPQADQGSHAKPAARGTSSVNTHAVGGSGRGKAQAGKREERDSIDAWFRGG